MYRKNTASQFICFQMLLTATGAVATGLSPAVRRCIDGTFAAGGGTVTEDGTTGSYKYAMAQADTNGNDISLVFSAATAMPVCINFVTTAADPTSASSFGLTNLDATISSRASQTSLDTVDDFVDTEVAAIKAKTDQLVFTVANQVDSNVIDWKSAVAPAMTGDAFARLGAPAGASVSADVAAVKVDTAAVKAKTDNLPVDPADASDIAAAFAVTNGKIDVVDDFLDTEIAAIKTQTDKFVFTVANQVDSNVLALNGDATSAANIAKTTKAIARGTASGVPTTTSIPTSAFTPSGSVADQFKGRIVTFDANTTTAALRGQATDITASTNAATPVLTVTALTTAPVSGDTFSVT